MKSTLSTHVWRASSKHQLSTQKYHIVSHSKLMKAHGNIPIEMEDEEILSNSGSFVIPETQNATEENHEIVNFPMTQSSPDTTALIKQAELSRRVFLYLIEKYNLAPSVVLHSLYINSGDVDACEAYLSDAQIKAPWSLEEDHLILTDSDCSQIIAQKGLEALRERRTFLYQICFEAIGNCSEITSKLK